MTLVGWNSVSILPKITLSFSVPRRKHRLDFTDTPLPDIKLFLEYPKNVKERIKNTYHPKIEILG